MATELKGGSQLRKALRKFEPDLAKALTKEMAVALKPIVVKLAGLFLLNQRRATGEKPVLQGAGRSMTRLL